MSQAWNEGYFTDVGYTFGYYREINPVFQRFCLLLNGFSAPAPKGEIYHCELGFGQGVSVNIHAAANPGQYIATDFNPAHAAHAQRLAQAAGSDARLYDDSFEQLLNRNDLPQFDSISLHGIWTWVSRDNHRIITEFIRRHLKPGGICFVSYNCFPGWAPFYPLRQLFALHDRFVTGSSAAVPRVEAALKFSQDLLAANPNYCLAVPLLPEKLKSIAEGDRHYLAHEYFNRDWNCMYFTDVVDTLTPAKLEWGCAATPLDKVDAANLRADAQVFLATIEHPVLREQARDYFINQQFRKDIFLRGINRMTAAQQQDALLETRLVLMKIAADVPMTMKGAVGEVTLQEDLYRPFIDVLAADHYRPKTLRTVLAQIPPMPWPHLMQMLAILLHLDAIAPCHDEDTQQQVRQRCKTLNRHLCERARQSSEIVFLANPATGGGINVHRFGQLFLLAREHGKKQPTEWAHFAWQILAAQNERIVKDGKALDTHEENLAEMTRQADEFNDKMMPILKALQVV
ncbi:MAG: class I SAM-dependent methyltransferase [Sterolibacterium sp.]|nr:class I SAM-dependent methyltransferase [Sterolibacterium sp.]MBP9800460.1 class I SAM-dependent methyltransferase [Sterolibacterium sp.]